jgi:hypothetical protein
VSSNARPPGEDVAAQLAAAEARCSAAEERASSALSLFSAVARLHEAATRADVLCAIGEVSVACLDAPALAVYLRVGSSDRLVAAHVVGRSAARPASTLLGAGLVGRAAAERRILVGPWRPSNAIDVAVPLAADPPGVMVLLGLHLPDATLGPDLRVRMEIVAHHAAIALDRTG